MKKTAACDYKFSFKLVWNTHKLYTHTALEFANEYKAELQERSPSCRKIFDSDYNIEVTTDEATKGMNPHTPQKIDDGYRSNENEEWDPGTLQGNTREKVSWLINVSSDRWNNENISMYPGS